ncbi:hypothetical protein BABINDRAFT_164802 [Babjeviella inositovora NRRL Y-12698]|uniref:Uncharacterized protein n=1 Tax=Babjeviella inositovora NRRL Y-12698 TaxID=984486 RepID=A0A1E3QZX4_9ASCO|nr:uncharacterized protein BABINDRAFT_164802 [Babjeviella inositovora NRRL Y-12698]ODQ83094.1 hypothetical protein BABINDRAFT_164802 [Babjeviella inositovora NRRL Y-12698]
MFTPLESGIGALLLQVATTSYLIQCGKIIGISSILTAVWDIAFRTSKPKVRNDSNATDLLTHELSLILGLATSCYFIPWYLPDFSPRVQLDVIRLPMLEQYTTLDHLFTEEHDLFKVIAFSSFLIGFGTKLGSGCTSGHMLSGLSRLSYRSIVATAVFCTTAMTVSFNTLKKNPSFPGDVLTCLNEYGVATECWRVDSHKFFDNQSKLLTLLAAVIVIGYFVMPGMSGSVDKSAIGNSLGSSPILLRMIAAEFSGFVFGCGLFISGMAENLKVLRFLSLGGALFTGDFSSFDPSLLMIILFCIVPNVYLWNFYILPQTNKPVHAKGSKKVEQSNEILPLLHEEFLLVKSTQITPKFLIGNMLFGAGWGLLGICPGPGFLNWVLTFQEDFSGNTAAMTLWYLSFVVGRYTAGLC